MYDSFGMYFNKLKKWRDKEISNIKKKINFDWIQWWSWTHDQTYLLWYARAIFFLFYSNTQCDIVSVLSNETGFEIDLNFYALNSIIQWSLSKEWNSALRAHSTSMRIILFWEKFVALCHCINRFDLFFQWILLLTFIFLFFRLFISSLYNSFTFTLLSISFGNQILGLLPSNKIAYWTVNCMCCQVPTNEAIMSEWIGLKNYFIVFF